MTANRDLGKWFNEPDEFLSILDASYDGLAITDGDGITLWTNKAYSDITGVQVSASLCRSPEEE